MAPRFLIVAWLLATVVAWLAAAGEAAAQSQRPVVAVGFEVEAPTFRRNLPRRAEAEQDLARRLADELGRRYRFADWLPAPDPAATIGALVARLVEVPAQPGPQIAVRWFARFGDDPLQLTNLLPVEIYAPSNPDWDTNNARSFVSRVAQAVLPVVRTDGFQRDVAREVVQRLPIATGVVADEADRVILVPRMWKDLQLGQQSKLVVVFVRGSGGAEERGMLRLALPTPRARDPGLGWVQAGVTEASFGPRPLPLTQGWNARLPDLLGGAQIVCFIGEYQPLEFTGTRGGVALTAE